MIYVYTGRIGSGKTYSMVKDAHKEWLRGVDVYSNTKLLFNEKIGFIDKLYYTIKKLLFLKPEYPRRGSIYYFKTIHEITDARNGIILFDEGNQLFSARNWDSLPDEFIYCLQESRKHDLTVFCTTQSIMSIDITYRRLVQVWYYMNPIIRILGFNLFQKQLKDVDLLYRDNSDLSIRSLHNTYFMIGFLSKVLYDTNFIIGFKKLKVICYKYYDGKQKSMKILMTDQKKFSPNGFKQI